MIAKIITCDYLSTLVCLFTLQIVAECSALWFVTSHKDLLTHDAAAPVNPFEIMFGFCGEPGFANGNFGM